MKTSVSEQLPNGGSPETVESAILGVDERMTQQLICEPIIPDANNAALVEACLPWVFDATTPYLEWVVGSREAPISLLRTWMAHPKSEVSIARAFVLRSGADVAGGFIAMSGAEVLRARTADSLSLVKSLRHGRDKSWMARWKESAELFPAPHNDDFYLSRMGIATPFRGRGYAKLLMKKYLEVGIARNYRRFRLDVVTTNDVAIRMYERFGFRRISVHHSSDGSVSYQAMEYVAR
jgi:ribosomal protein S18 acetylase RimI-like enzyme